MTEDSRVKREKEIDLISTKVLKIQKVLKKKFMEAMCVKVIERLLMKNFSSANEPTFHWSMIMMK